jgi:hypothetical protein
MKDTLPQFILERTHTPFSALHIKDEFKPQTLHPHEVINASYHAPLLSNEEVAAQVGRSIGDLMAVVQLPVKYAFIIGAGPVNDIEAGDWKRRRGNSYGHTGAELDSRLGATQIYCFRTEAKGRHSKGGYEYLLMGSRQIEEMKVDTYDTDNFSAINGGVLALKPGSEQMVGRDPKGWLPSVGRDYGLLVNDDPHLREIYQSVSRKQALIQVSPEGQLLISGQSESYAHNGNDMTVVVGELLPTYPYAHALGHAGLSTAA